MLQDVSTQTKPLKTAKWEYKNFFFPSFSAPKILYLLRQILLTRRELEMVKIKTPLFHLFVLNEREKV